MVAGAIGVKTVKFGHNAALSTLISVPRVAVPTKQNPLGLGEVSFMRLKEKAKFYVISKERER